MDNYIVFCGTKIALAVFIEGSIMQILLQSRPHIGKSFFYKVPYRMHRGLGPFYMSRFRPNTGYKCRILLLALDIRKGRTDIRPYIRGRICTWLFYNINILRDILTIVFHVNNNNKGFDLHQNILFYIL